MKLGTNTAVAAALLALSLSGCGSDGPKAADTPAWASASPSSDYSNIPGMAMGAPPQTVSQNCDGSSCDLVFILPSKELGNPYGVAVGVVSADPSKAVITVAGKQYTVEQGHPLHAGGLTITMPGPPGASLTLNVKEG
ncbi:MAG TPA: hypothetical protein VGL04_04445 [Sporichthyaceae bacterium]|jgi:hypothetical protein